MKNYQSPIVVIEVLANDEHLGYFLETGIKKYPCKYGVIDNRLIYIGDLEEKYINKPTMNVILFYTPLGQSYKYLEDNIKRLCVMFRTTTDYIRLKNHLSSEWSMNIRKEFSLLKNQIFIFRKSINAKVYSAFGLIDYDIGIPVNLSYGIR